MIVAASVLAYLAAGLFVARYAYGWMRAKSIDGNMKHYRVLCSTTEEAVREWQDSDRIMAIFAAVFVLALWPAIVLVPAVLWFARFLDGSARLSQAEHRDQLAARDRRIAELEREAGIR